jgi:carbon-monoxide dehydrogenase medium subunit
VKPPVVDYRRPDDLEEALELLAEYGDEAKPLAGGQSLVPMLNLRLARPAVLVDIKRLALSDIDQRDGELVLGALVRQRALEEDPRVAATAPLLARMAPSIGHPAIRNRGTIGGSLAHAEPTAELPLAAVTLGARIEAVSTRGRREIAAGDLFAGPFTTTLEPDELVIAVRFPAARAGERVAFAEIAQRSGDFALTAAACRLVVQNGMIVDAAVVIAGVASIPHRATAAEQALTGRPASAEVADEAAHAALDGVQPPSDIHASAEFRRHLARVMTRQVLLEACGAPEEER